MTIEMLMLIFEIIIAINVIIQGTWFYIWLQDRKENKTNMYLLNMLGDNGVHANNNEEFLQKIINISAETSNQQLEIIDRLNIIRVNTMNTAKNTNTYRKK